LLCSVRHLIRGPNGKHRQFRWKTKINLLMITHADVLLKRKFDE